MLLLHLTSHKQYESLLGHTTWARFRCHWLFCCVGYLRARRRVGLAEGVGTTHTAGSLSICGKLCAKSAQAVPLGAPQYLAPRSDALGLCSCAYRPPFNNGIIKCNCCLILYGTVLAWGTHCQLFLILEAFWNWTAMWVGCVVLKWIQSLEIVGVSSYHEICCHFNYDCKCLSLICFL